MEYQNYSAELAKKVKRGMRETRRKGFYQGGRVVIPISMRKTNNLGVEDPVDISVENDSIVIRKSGPACVFCGKKDGNLLTFHGRTICKSCLQEIAENKN